eukprot:tig00000802_g4282.t1
MAVIEREVLEGWRGDLTMTERGLFLAKRLVSRCHSVATLAAVEDALEDIFDAQHKHKPRVELEDTFKEVRWLLLRRSARAEREEDEEKAAARALEAELREIAAEMPPELLREDQAAEEEETPASRDWAPPPTARPPHQSLRAWDGGARHDVACDVEGLGEWGAAVEKELRADLRATSAQKRKAEVALDAAHADLRDARDELERRPPLPPEPLPSGEVEGAPPEPPPAEEVGEAQAPAEGGEEAPAEEGVQDAEPGTARALVDAAAQTEAEEPAGGYAADAGLRSLLGAVGALAGEDEDGYPDSDEAPSARDDLVDSAAALRGALAALDHRFGPGPRPFRPPSRALSSVRATAMRFPRCSVTPTAGSRRRPAHRRGAYAAFWHRTPPALIPFQGSRALAAGHSGAGPARAGPSFLPPSGGSFPRARAAAGPRPAPAAQRTPRVTPSLADAAASRRTCRAPAARVPDGGGFAFEKGSRAGSPQHARRSPERAPLYHSSPAIPALRRHSSAPRSSPSSAPPSSPPPAPAPQPPPPPAPPPPRAGLAGVGPGAGAGGPGPAALAPGAVRGGAGGGAGGGPRRPLPGGPEAAGGASALLRRLPGTREAYLLHQASGPARPAAPARRSVPLPKEEPQGQGGAGAGVYSSVHGASVAAVSAHLMASRNPLLPLVQRH